MNSTFLHSSLPIHIYDSLLAWLERLKLCWSELFPLKINTIEIDERVKTIKDKYPDVFSGKLGCLKDFKVHIPLPDNIQP